MPAIEAELFGKPATEAEATADSEERIFEQHVSEDHVAATTSDWEDLYGNFISEMEPTRAEILRATPAYEALRCFGQPLRQGHFDLYHRSQVTTRIQEFWSHSWHGPTWLKIATLLFVNNGTAAASLSTVAAVLAAMLYYFGILPTFFGQPIWGTVTGFVTYVLTLIFWCRRQRVFVDRICISQLDDELKGEALMSLGAFLKSADAMLVLWDPTYMDRLWCQFELAAFLHSRQRGTKTELTIRPTLLGPLFIITITELMLLNLFTGYVWGLVGRQFEFAIMTVVVGGIIFWYTAHMGREYCRTIEKVRNEIEYFSVEKLKSYCCSMDHKDPITGEPMFCDRKVILRCIRTWFGTVHNFEHRVRSEVLQILTDQLYNEVLSYGQLVTGLAPIFWPYVDLAWDWLLRDGTQEAVHNIMRGLTIWLAFSPTMIFVMFRVAYWVRRKRSLLMLDVLMSSLLILCTAFIFVVYTAAELSSWLLILPDMRIVAGITFTVPAATVAVLTWKFLPNISLRSSTQFAA